MKTFFRFIRNIFLLLLIAFGIWTYQHNPNVQIATRDSLATLDDRITQLLTTGTVTAPKIGDREPTVENKTSSSKSENDTEAGNRTWRRPETNIYVDIDNNQQLRSDTIDAINAWNRTGAFTFNQVTNKADAQVTVSVIDDSSTNAAGETATTYNPTTGHLLKAHVHLNRFYLQNQWYGYSNNRIVNTAEHELGHAIGLNHTNAVSVMYPKGSIYTIQPCDIHNVKKIYHEK